MTKRKRQCRHSQWCKRPARHGSDYCWSHDPKTAWERHLAAKQAVRTRAKKSEHLFVVERCTDCPFCVKARKVGFTFLCQAAKEPLFGLIDKPSPKPPDFCPLRIKPIKVRML